MSVPQQARLALAVLLAIGLSISLQAQKLKPATKIVQQANSPVSIASYTASYESRTSQYVQRGIHHAVQYQNQSGRDIAAVQIGLISFDIWNEFLDRTNGLDTDGVPAKALGRGTWIATALNDFSFLTGVAYVRRVRFADGEIWTADEEAVLSELRTIQKDFDAKALRESERAQQQ